jgi:hypothetical protein
MDSQTSDGRLGMEMIGIFIGESGSIPNTNIGTRQNEPMHAGGTRSF